MSLPPGFLDELRSRVSIAQVAGRKVTWDQRKSNQARGDWWAPCPFHQEKTASFHVEDRKGFYYCFGCHAKGDVINFVRETENVDFMEAVRILAAEAGMEVPERDPQAQQKADRRTQLSEVMEQAVQHYKMSLKTRAAEEARAYLERRGLSPEAQERWELGFAPHDRQGVFQHLTGKGTAPELTIDVGLCAKPDDGGAPYDRFRGRIMFPIRDARGRAIAFGGRAMDPNARAKYYNSPETPLFHKGHNLYNHGPAREAAGKGKTLIVAEGYMDVIALSEAGFTATVAPLGTAITEDQLRLLWRIAPEPIIALDGDKAGLRAAYKLIDLALPLLEAGQSLRFALMPEGQDPDDLIRAKGASAMQALIDQALPMVDLLWRRETEGRTIDSPERKAALDKDLRAAISRIQDGSIRQHYGQAIKDLRWQLFRGQREYRPTKRGRIGASMSARNSMLSKTDTEDQNALREMLILAVLIRIPAVLPEFRTELEELELDNHEHQALLTTILSGEEPTPEALERLWSHPHLSIEPTLRSNNIENAKMCVSAELARLSAERGHTLEMEEFFDDLDDAGEHVVRRIQASQDELERVTRTGDDDRTLYDKGDNGALISREERDALDNLLDQITYSKKKT